MSDKELIEKMNRKMESDRSVKKVPVKIVNKECNEKDEKESEKTKYLVDYREEEDCDNPYGCKCKFKETTYCEPCDNCCKKSTPYDIKKHIKELKDVYENFKKNEWQQEFQKRIEGTPLENVLGFNARFLCTPLGQAFINLFLEKDINLYLENEDKLNKTNEKPKDKVTEVYKTPLPSKISLTPNNDSLYKVFDFKKSKELINKLDSIDKGIPLTEPSKTLIEQLTNCSNACDTEEIIAKIKTEIIKKKEIHDKKANEVWNFIRENRWAMDEYMNKFNNQEITINELNTLFDKYIDMWNLLRETI